MDMLLFGNRQKTDLLRLCGGFFFFARSLMLTIDHLYFSYTGRPPWVLDDVCLSVRRGDYISIVGENGCGKSTLLKLILGFLSPVSGSIQRSPGAVRYVSQTNASIHKGFPITVKESLDSYRRLLSIRDRSETDRVLALVGMEDFRDRLVGDLSGGQQQRIALARSFLGRPSLILLDEPSTGVDRPNQAVIYGLLKEMNRTEQVTILSVEHNLDAALENSTRIYHLKEGRGHLCSPEKYAREIMAFPESLDKEVKAVTHSV